MIFNIRGTSGSGKSTIVRTLMDLYDSRIAYRQEKRKQPIGYICSHPSVKSLAVIGHYETDCGGCDTIQKMDEIFRLVRLSNLGGHHVVYEGLLISADVNRTAALHQENLALNVHAIELPIEECLARVNGRRLAKAQRTGREYRGDVNPKNTQSKHRGVMKSMERLQALGVPAEFGTQDQIIDRIKMELGL